MAPRAHPACRLILAALATLAAWTMPARAQGPQFPAKPITFIVPWNAGGSTHILAWVVKVIEVMDRYDFVNRYMNAADYTASIASVIETERAALEKMGMLRKD